MLRVDRSASSVFSVFAVPARSPGLGGRRRTAAPAPWPRPARPAGPAAFGRARVPSGLRFGSKGFVGSLGRRVEFFFAAEPADHNLLVSRGRTPNMREALLIWYKVDWTEAIRLFMLARPIMSVRELILVASSSDAVTQFPELIGQEDPSGMCRPCFCTQSPLFFLSRR